MRFLRQHHRGSVLRHSGHRQPEGPTMSTPRLLSVLIVYDSPFVRARLRRLLEESDSRCVLMEAACVADVARVLANVRPDVVVLDLSLPDGNGFDLLPRI